MLLDEEKRLLRRGKDLEEDGGDEHPAGVVGGDRPTPSGQVAESKYVRDSRVDALEQQVPSRSPSSNSTLAKQGSSTQASVSEEENKTSGDKDANAKRQTSLLSPASEAEAVHVDVPVTTTAEPAPAPVHQTRAHRT